MTSEYMELWLLLGIISCHIGIHHKPAGLRHIEVRVLFWKCLIKQQPSGLHDWMLRIHPIEKLRRLIWVVVMSLNNSELDVIGNKDSNNTADIHLDKSVQADRLFR